jgi:DNA-binding NarL/FixJ family response regulator
MHMRIAIVDRFPIVRTGLSIFLCGAVDNIKVRSFSTLVELASAHHAPFPDLVIVGSDGRLPLAEDIRKTRQLFPGVKLILLDEFPAPEQVISYIQAGLHGYVPKLSGATELILCIDAVMSGRMYFATQAWGFSQSDLNPAPERAVNLSRREKEIASLLVTGMSTNDIAYRLDRKPSTVSTMKKNIFNKLGIKNVIELCRLCGL